MIEGAIMRRSLSVALCCLSLAPAWARAEEQRDANNSLYLELGGNGAIYSLNYERFVRDDVSLRLGFGYVSLKGANIDGGTVTADMTLLTIPVTASYLGIGAGNHRLELGGGVVFADINGSSSSDGAKAFGSASGVVGTAMAGYRYVRPRGGFTFRAAFTPLFGEGGFQPWAGVAFGYGF
jgi:hypothetical protein